jgi:RNA recognition motif-containing protein
MSSPRYWMRDECLARADQELQVRLFIGNLPYNVTSEDLERTFSEAGTVTSARVITDRETGQSRGFGFVEMGSAAEGQKAITMWNGQDMNGRALTVNEARPMAEGRGGAAGGGGGSRGGGGRY